MFIVAYEETKYVPSQHGRASISIETELQSTGELKAGSVTEQKEKFTASNHQRLERLDSSTPRKTYFQRLSILTTSPGGWSKFTRHLYQPFLILLTVPAVAYTALIWGSLLAWFSVIVSVYSVYFTFPPYNFSSSAVGLMNLPPFIGGIFGSIYGGLLSDWLIIRLSRRNKGIYEPEMRLWLSLPMIFIMPGSILLFGLPIARGMPWIVPAVGAGVFGFTLATMGDIAVTYTMDCYKEVSSSVYVSPEVKEPVANGQLDNRRCVCSGLLHPQRFCNPHRHDTDRLDQWRGFRCRLWDFSSIIIPLCCNNDTHVDLGQADEDHCVEKRVVAEDEESAVWCEGVTISLLF